MGLRRGVALVVLLGGLCACGGGGSDVGGAPPPGTQVVPSAARVPSSSTAAPGTSDERAPGVSVTGDPGSVGGPGESASAPTQKTEKPLGAAVVVRRTVPEGSEPAVPAPGTAGGGDDQFLADLAAVGLGTPDPAAAVALGRSSCEKLAAGSPLTAVVETVGAVVGSDAVAAGAVVGAAVVSFCPQLGRALGG